MANKNAFWIGADPGGKGKFGLAILSSKNKAETTIVNCVDEAINFIREALLDQAPAGIGVDAPLWWSSGPSGGRKVDQWLRTKYQLRGEHVQQVNSLRGAALTQALMFVQRMRELYPEVQVTECHPKALLRSGIFGAGNNLSEAWERFKDIFSLCVPKTLDEDKRDALICAVCAREGFQRRWKTDLSLKRNQNEQDPSSYWLAPVHYYWPK